MDVGPERGFPERWDHGGANGGGPGKKTRRGQEGAKYRGVRGGRPTPKSPKGCWDYFLRESNAILASSGVAGTCFFRFSTDGAGIRSVVSGKCR